MGISLFAKNYFIDNTGVSVSGICSWCRTQVLFVHEFKRFLSFQSTCEQKV